MPTAPTIRQGAAGTGVLVWPPASDPTTCGGADDLVYELYVSTTPERFPMLHLLGSDNVELGALARRVDAVVGQPRLAEELIAEQIGVGTGRIAIPAASRGAHIYGVDLSREMLEVAESKAQQAGPLDGELTLVEADMRSLDLGRKDFDLVIMPARTLLLATSYEEQLDALCRAAAHLKPGGRLVFNAFNPTPDLIFDDSELPVEIGSATDPASGIEYVLSAVNRFDTESQINDATQIVHQVDENGELKEVASLPVRLRYLHPHEVFSLCEEIGLNIESIFGWFDRSTFTEDSEELVVVASRPALPSA